MKKNLILSVFLLLISFEKISAQDNSEAKEKSFSFATSYFADGLSNLSGGIKKGTVYMGMVHIMLGFDTEKAGLWKGGNFYANLSNTHGGQASADLIGDFQTASNIEAGNLNYMQELYYKQSIANFKIFAGLLDMNQEFNVTDYGGLFLNSSSGIYPTISSNLPVPIFPLTALGTEFIIDFSDNFSYKIGFFDGLPDDFQNNNTYNMNWKLRKDDGYLAVSEFEFKNTSENKPGAYKMGVYFHNEHKIHTETEAGLISETHPSNFGLYLVANQTIIRTESGKDFGIFTQFGYAPKDKNPNWIYAGLGINCKALFNNRKDDIFGFAVNHAEISGDIGSETALELTYKAQLTENIFIQPDFQYIINPAGTDVKLENATVAVVRLEISF